MNRQFFKGLESIEKCSVVIQPKIIPEKEYAMTNEVCA
jgi:hypothetical protein